jgi:hypothetical protein
METNGNNSQQQDQPVKGYSGKGEGMQGIDKAPGEEPSEGSDNFIREAQKGKKVDADPSKESDQPLKQ